MARQSKGALFGQGAMGGIGSALDMLLMQKMGLFGGQGKPPQQGEGLPPDRMIGPQRIPPMEAMGNSPMAPPPPPPPKQGTGASRSLFQMENEEPLFGRGVRRRQGR